MNTRAVFQQERERRFISEYVVKIGQIYANAAIDPFTVDIEAEIKALAAANPQHKKFINKAVKEYRGGNA